MVSWVCAVVNLTQGGDRSTSCGFPEVEQLDTMQKIAWTATTTMWASQDGGVIFMAAVQDHSCHSRGSVLIRIIMPWGEFHYKYVATMREQRIAQRGRSLSLRKHNVTVSMAWEVFEAVN